MSRRSARVRRDASKRASASRVSTSRAWADGQRGALAVEAGVAIEQRELHRRIEQRLVLVLPVQIDQRSDRFAQRRGGDQLSVEEGAAPALGRDFASDDQLLAGRRVEDRLDYRCFFA